MKRSLLSAVTVVALALAGSALAKDAKGKQPTGREAMAQHEQVVTIEVTKDGFVPAEIKVKAGHPLKLVVTRKVDRTCATEIVIKDFNINKPLPLNKAVEVTFTPSKPGKIRYACAMDMIAGTIVVE
jgi:plastocyanin domain-containing protein